MRFDWALNPRTGVFIRERRGRFKTDIERERPCEVEA